MSDRVFYVLECQAEGLDVEFYLNDIPVVRRGDALGTYYGGQSNELVVDGTNTLSMVLRPGLTPTEALLPRAGRRERVVVDEAFASARLRRYPYGAVVGGPDAEELLSVEWFSQADGEGRPWPQVATAQVDLGPVFGRWAWQDAERLVLDDLAADEISALLAELRDSLSQGDPEPFIAKSRVRFDDVTRAYQLSPGSKVDQFRRLTARDASKPHWGIQPLTAVGPALRLCAGGRMVQCAATDWDPLLREEPDPETGSRGSYGIFVSKIDGTWEIVR